mgnify:CR=1 FL=1
MVELHNMDCMELMKRYPDNYFDLSIVDPPYGIEESGGVSGGETLHKKGRRFSRKELLRWDKKPNKKYFDELARVSKNRIIWGGNYFNLPPTRCVIVWDKVQPWETFSKVEIAWTSFAGPANLFKFDNRTGGKIHPTQKPIALYKWLLDNYAKQGDKILDTHLGSGSSAIAAYQLGYDFVGCELDKDYFQAMEKRVKQAMKQTNLFQSAEEKQAEQIKIF